MKESTENRCRQFIKNKEVIRKEFSWESTYMYPLCAAIFTMNGKEADGGQLKACTELLRQHTGMFSNFRSTARLPIASLMAVGVFRFCLSASDGDGNCADGRAF